MNVNTYLAKQYASPPCWALVADVLHTECGFPLVDYRPAQASLRAIAGAFRLAMFVAPRFKPLAQPSDYAIVLLSRTKRLGMHHCGVYWRGSVLHALPSAILLQDLASLRDIFPLMEFWGPV